ncbi:sprT domain-containing protein [Flammeovirga sp. MY04]|uniref:SprT-like domain-containing protein n=1 Tax=Flammeovirga sp. MY04 TaxID=1191459 RepID=UPI00080641C3|nr:SprT-like domain-containing protein [Flammeovirga sp. MY04]ANQ50986.1 sprT domain-containing protein [Flammeovirga sp. MY04]
MSKNNVSHQDIVDSLSKYTPKQAAIIFADWILHYKIHVKITKERKTRLGDYRPPQRGYGHKISINHSLNPYQFAITFAHEVAHLVVWDQFQNKVAPHGKEWKQQFGNFLQLLLNHNVFPEDLIEAVTRHRKKPSASSGNDVQLKKALMKYDKEEENENETLFLDDLNDGDTFILENHGIFIRNKKLRKYYLCTEKSTGKQFRINSLAKVSLV